MLPNIPHEVIEHEKMLLNPDPNVRPDAEQMTKVSCNVFSMKFVILCVVVSVSINYIVCGIKFYLSTI